jgi:hypothetical protein
MKPSLIHIRHQKPVVTGAICWAFYDYEGLLLTWLVWISHIRQPVKVRTKDIRALITNVVTCECLFCTYLPSKSVNGSSVMTYLQISSHFGH